jgi:3',5'-cyclic AMP phosphodiesterase CpdA
VRVIQISDTHLSPTKAHFTGNWPPLERWIAAQHADLVIHTGDVTIDGADVEEDLRYSAALLRRLDRRLLAVPGNHDVGDAGHRHQPVGATRLARWRAHLGAERWVEDVEGFRLIGINAMVLGSGDPEEAAQAAWLDRVMSEANERSIGWFLHRPLFLEDPAEGDTGYWSVKPQPRAALMALIRRHRVAFVASGHLHKAHSLEVDGTRYLWAPSSAFICGPIQPAMPGEKWLGAVVYDIAGDAFTARLVEIPELARYVIDDVADEVYPRQPE